MKIIYEAGYHGKSMSNNAVLAYEHGEKPYSKWTKRIILSEINELIEDEDIPDYPYRKLNLETLRHFFLKRTSWHHTGSLYNETNFYSLDIDKLKNMTDKDFEFYLNNQIKSEPKTKTDISKLNSAKELYNKLYIIYKAGVGKQKSLLGLCRAYAKGTINDNDINKLYSKALQVLKEKESSRIQAWKTTKFKTTDIEKYYHSLIDLYNNDFEQYIIDKLVPKDVNSNSKEIQLLKTAIN